jgi:transposase-like protein
MDPESGRKKNNVSRRPRKNNSTPAMTAPRTESLHLGEAANTEADREGRARPGRRSVEDRNRAVLELLAGKATVDQLARRLGVLPATVEGWRDDALSGIEDALRRGSGKTASELAMERKLRELEEVVTTLSIQKCLLENALTAERGKRPTEPARSKR